jgi:hypothetical protein
MSRNFIIIGSVLAVAIGIGYWYYISNQEKDTEAITPEDKEELEKIKIV